MAATGNVYENAMMESFFKTLKHKEVHLYEYETYHHVVTRLPHFIEDVYNQKRLHSALGYRPPNEFEEVVLTQRINTTPPDSPNPICPIIGVQSIFPETEGGYTLQTPSLSR
ncbi:integrase core domain-containing protein [Dehalococcoidia bacterium]|nr:integrase core domain-containing protein [Dehalococcoidia bacterium]